MIFTKPKAFQFQGQIILACFVTLFMLTSQVNAAQVDCVDCKAAISSPRQQYLKTHEHATIDIEILSMDLSSRNSKGKVRGWDPDKKDEIPPSYTLQVFINNEPVLDENIFAFSQDDGSGLFNIKTGFRVIVPTGEDMELRFEGWNGTYKGKITRSPSGNQRGWDGTYKGEPVKIFSGSHRIPIEDNSHLLLSIKGNGHGHTGHVTVLK